MKYLFTVLFGICSINLGQAQNVVRATNMCENTVSKDKAYNPVNDYVENQLENTATMPGYQSASNKLIVTGTIFKSDGVTPAKDVIFYIQQANENGDYEVTINDSLNRKHINHRAWVKTDSDGKYTFYTFMPGATVKPLVYPHKERQKHIHAFVKEAGKAPRQLHAFIFDNDELLTKACRRKLARRGIDNILKTETKDGILVANKDIVLPESTPDL